MPQHQSLTFDRVFASPSLSGAVPSNVALSPNGEWLTMLRARKDDRERFDLWGFDKASGEWRMMVDSLKLGSGRELTEAEKMQRERQRIGDLKGIVTYNWASDSKSLLVPLDGDLLLVGLDGTITKLTGASDDVLNPALSPKGSYVSYVKDRQLYVGKIGAPAIAITPQEANEAVHWGEAEFVAQEEMDRMSGYWWAEDESRIAIQRFDETGVATVTRAAIGAEGTKTFTQRYPLAGTQNAIVKLYVQRPDGSERVEVDLGPNPDIYLARVDWAKDSKTLYVQRENRAQTVLDLLEVDPTTGRTKVLFTEKAAKGHWINLSSAYHFMKDGSLIWRSERDGYGHLYHYNKGVWKQLTKGKWVVTSLVGVNEETGELFFNVNKDDVLASQVYRLNLKGKGEITRLTDLAYSNSASMDKAGKQLLISRSSISQPPQVYLADLTGKRLTWVEENAVNADHPIAPYLPTFRPKQYGIIKAEDGSDLHWSMITPPLVEGKKYPVFFDHYGGPSAQTVSKGWTSPLAQAIVAKGYIYFQIDNRGSPNRGVAFEKQIYRAMGSVEVADQLAGAKYLKSLPFVDPAKIAINGWSYGGYMTIKMLQANPGVYAAGIAGASVTKWELYDTHYTERYMGNPDPKVDGATYTKASAIPDAAKITDPLMIIHGMADDNVVFENSSAIIAKMQAEAVPFEMMLYPGHTHRVGGPKTSVHLMNTIFAFLERHGVKP